MTYTNKEKIMIRKLILIEIERLSKRKNYYKLNKEEEEEYKIYCELYKELEV